MNTTESTATQTAPFTVKILPNDKDYPAGKLAEAELIFTEAAGPLFGLRLIGFAVWERKTGAGRNVTFPARQYSVNGERRSFALLRPTGHEPVDGQAAVRDAILAAYAEHEADRAPAGGDFDGTLDMNEARAVRPDLFR